MSFLNNPVDGQIITSNGVEYIYDATIEVWKKYQPDIVPATDVTLDTTNFGNNLSTTEDTVQKALEVLDDLVSGSGGSLTVFKQNLPPTTFNDGDIWYDINYDIIYFGINSSWVSATKILEVQQGIYFSILSEILTALPVTINTDPLKDEVSHLKMVVIKDTDSFTGITINGQEVAFEPSTTNETTIVDIAYDSLNTTSYLLLSDGVLYASGSKVSSNVFIQDTSISDTVIKLFQGYQNVFLQTSTLNIKGIGYNANGQLGVGSTTNQSTWVDVSGISDIKKISVNQYHSVAVDNSGKIFTTGENTLYQLGHGNNTNLTSFTEVTSISNVIDAATTTYSTLVILSDGTGKGVGGNNYGELGLGDTADRTDWVAIPNFSDMVECNGTLTTHSATMFCRDSSGKLWGSGENYVSELGFSGSVSTFTDLNEISTGFAVGYACILSVSSTGELRVCGEDYRHQLGTSGNVSSFTTISSITNINRVVTTTGLSFAFNDIAAKGIGDNDSGQLGINDTIDNQPTWTDIVFTLPTTTGYKAEANYFSITPTRSLTIESVDNDIQKIYFDAFNYKPELVGYRNITSGALLTDGSNTMNDLYVPNAPKSVVTVDYLTDTEIVDTLPTASLAYFRKAVYCIDTGTEHVCVANVINPTQDSDCFWYQR